MCYTGLFKRIVPFVLTFAVGLFLASFFVSVGLPGERWRDARRFDRINEVQQLRLENDKLREKLRNSRVENEELRRSLGDADFVIPVAPPVDFDEHHPPPPPPRQPKRMRVDSLQ